MADSYFSAYGEQGAAFQSEPGCPADDIEITIRGPEFAQDFYVDAGDFDGAQVSRSAYNAQATMHQVAPKYGGADELGLALESAHFGGSSYVDIGNTEAGQEHGAQDYPFHPSTSNRSQSFKEPSPPRLLGVAPPRARATSDSPPFPQLSTSGQFDTSAVDDDDAPAENLPQIRQPTRQTPPPQRPFISIPGHEYSPYHSPNPGLLSPGWSHPESESGSSVSSSPSHSHTRWRPDNSPDPNASFGRFGAFLHVPTWQKNVSEHSFFDQELEDRGRSIFRKTSPPTSEDTPKALTLEDMASLSIGEVAPSEQGFLSYEASSQQSTDSQASTYVGYSYTQDNVFGSKSSPMPDQASVHLRAPVFEDAYFDLNAYNMGTYQRPAHSDTGSLRSTSAHSFAPSEHAGLDESVIGARHSVASSPFDPSGSSAAHGEPSGALVRRDSSQRHSRRGRSPYQLPPHSESADAFGHQRGGSSSSTGDSFVDPQSVASGSRLSTGPPSPHPPHVWGGPQFDGEDSGLRPVGSVAGRRAALKRRKDKDKQGAFICDICEADFTAKHNLKNHMNSHESIKAFPCSKCDQSFGTAHVRKRHEDKCSVILTL